MAVHRGMNIVTDGLISYWDATNPKCYNTYNLLQYTEDFSNPYWSKAFGTITANTTIAPDGTMTADKFVESVGNANHNFGAFFINTQASGIYYTFSVYLKAAGRQWAILNLYDGADGVVWFDLVNFNVSSATYLGTAHKGSIVHVGNGWCRCSVTRLVTSSTLSVDITPTPGEGLTSVYTGDGVSGIYAWGAQLNRGKRAIPYQPNLTTLPVSTTVKDLVGTNNGTLTNGAIANASEGIYTFDGINDYINIADSDSLSFTSGGGNDLPFSISMWVYFTAFSYVGNWLINKRDNAANDEWQVIYYNNTISLQKFSSTPGNYQAVYANNSPTTGVWYHIVCTDNGTKLNSGMSIYINGVQQTTSSSNGGTYTGMINGTASVKIGTDWDVASNLSHNGKIAFPMIYNRALTANEVWQNYQATKERFITNPQ